MPTLTDAPRADVHTALSNRAPTPAEYAGFTTYLVVLAGAAQSIARGLDADTLWLLAAALPLGFLLADFISGMVHWTLDTWGTMDTPLLGPAIYHFRIHHIDAAEITRHGWIATVGHTATLAIPPAAAAWLLPVESGSPWSSFLACGAFALAAGISLTNVFHRWAHDLPERVPAFGRALQRAGIILSREHHKVHHTHPFITYYSITTGWTNAALAGIGWWRFLERLVSGATGMVPRKDDLGDNAVKRIAG
jgi:ubiquitin-conjugating enzyme E2 variant